LITYLELRAMKNASPTLDPRLYYYNLNKWPYITMSTRCLSTIRCEWFTFVQLIRLR